MTNTSATGRRRPGRPKKADAADTRIVLQHAALRLFARNGYAGTSIRAIAREVGLSESVLYAHFASKQAIFDTVLAEFGPMSPTEMARQVDPELDPPHCLRQFVRAVLVDWDTLDARLLISLMARDGLLHSPALAEALHGMRTAVARLLESWISAGHIPRDRGSAEDLALLFTSPIGLARILHLHADASADERTAAREEILRHVETFIRTVFR